MYWKIKAMLEEQIPFIEIVNTILEEIDPKELDAAPIGEIQAFIDLSHEVRMLCHARRGAV